MDEKDKEFEKELREKIETICKKQFMLGCSLAIEPPWKSCGNSPKT